MNNQKTTNKVFASILLAALLLIPVCFASLSFDSVTFFDPVDIEHTQTIEAEISQTNSTVSLVKLEIYGQNFTMALSGGAYAYSFSPQTLGTTPFSIHAIDNNSQIFKYSGSFNAVNISSPQITSKSPSGEINTETTTLTLTTNENANCKYDTTDETYSSMGDFFENTDDTTHSQLLTHLSSGEKTYYVACQNSAQKIRYDNLTFSVNLPPSADVDISGKSPLSADTYKITVITSKPLSNIPTLQYKYDDTTTYQEISLVGDDSQFTGYIVVPDSSDDRIGKFYFSGTDHDGLTGTKITSGERFIVDTSKPPVPSSIGVEIDEDNKIKLSWFYDGEEADYFNIYRKVSSGVQYVDFYDDDSSEPFEDSNVDDGDKYYYRVATVDKAGNVGELSDEVSIIFEDETANEEEKAKVAGLDLEFEEELNKTYREAKTLRFDADFELSKLERETDRFKTALISQLKLLEQLRAAKLNLDNILKELDSLRSQDLSRSDFNDEINSIESKIESVKENIIIDITVFDSLEFTESIGQAELKRVINEVLFEKGYGDEFRDNFTKAANNLQDATNVFQTIVIGKIKSIDGDVEYISLVTKEISVSTDAFDVFLIETIPKTFAKTSKDITFSSNPRVLNDDPVVYWSYPRLTSLKYSYYVKERKQLSDLKEANTIVLLDPVKALPNKGVYSQEDENKLTGNSVMSGNYLKNAGSYAFIGFGALVIAALVVYYFFFLKNDDHDTLESSSQFEAPINAHIIQKETKNIDQIQLETIEPPELKHVKNLIEHAKFYLENNEQKRAVEKYREIHSIYNNFSFKSKEQKAWFASQITQLHKEIMDAKKGDTQNN